MSEIQERISPAMPRFLGLSDTHYSRTGPLRQVKSRIYALRDEKETLEGEVLSCGHILYHYGVKPARQRHCAACGSTWNMEDYWAEGLQRARAGEGEELAPQNCFTWMDAEQGERVKFGVQGDVRRITVEDRTRWELTYQYRWFWEETVMGHQTRNEGPPFESEQEATEDLVAQLWRGGQQDCAAALASTRGIQLLGRQADEQEG